jgi:hypothetical protein
MTFTPADAALNAMADHLASLATHAQLHTGAPGAAGTNNVATSARQPIAWDAASSGDISLTGTELFTGGAANGPCTHVSLWSALTGGTFYGSLDLTGDTTFNAAGEYTLNDITLNGS